jgi:hypothetical protein
MLSSRSQGLVVEVASVVLVSVVNEMPSSGDEVEAAQYLPTQPKASGALAQIFQTQVYERALTAVKQAADVAALKLHPKFAFNGFGWRAPLRRAIQVGRMPYFSG